jgi:lactate 2-monooxygenase
MGISIGRSRQGEIYLNGFSGIKSKIPFNADEIERRAKLKLSRKAFGYISTGAGSHQGVRNNIEAFDRFTIIPRMLQGNETIDLSSRILNTNLPFPFLFAPVGVLGLAHPRGDIELAHASRQTGIPMIQSNQASCNMESCANVLANTDHWFQLYFSKSRALVESFVQRAADSGNKAIVLTLDTTILGWRTIDLENGYLPFLYGKGIAQYTSDPIFRELMKDAETKSTSSKVPGILEIIELFKSYPDSFLNNLRTKNPIKAVRTFVDIYSKPDLSWDDIKWLKSITKLPVLLKGILHPEDAKKALDFGIDGIIVSNHGGRQIDNVVSTLDALASIKSVLPETYPLLIDGGIRKGVDIFIALALGAKAVCLGRLYVYALALAGKEGVTELIQNLASELQIMMSLAGCKSVSEINGDYIKSR